MDRAGATGIRWWLSDSRSKTKANKTKAFIGWIIAKQEQSHSVALDLPALETRDQKVNFELAGTTRLGRFSVNVRTTEDLILLIYSENYYPFVKELSLITSGRPAGHNVSQYPITFSIYMYYLSLGKFPALLPIELNGYYENRAGHFSDLDV